VTVCAKIPFPRATAGALDLYADAAVASLTFTGNNVLNVGGATAKGQGDASGGGQGGRESIGDLAAAQEQAHPRRRSAHHRRRLRWRQPVR
jgi:hypothetical protein